VLAGVPNHLLVVLQAALLLLQGTLLLRGILPRETFFLVGRLVEVGWVAALAVLPVLHLVDRVYLVLAPVVGPLRRLPVMGLLHGTPYVRCVGEFLLLPPVGGKWILPSLFPLVRSL